MNLIYYIWVCFDSSQSFSYITELLNIPKITAIQSGIFGEVFHRNAVNEKQLKFCGKSLQDFSRFPELSKKLKIMSDSNDSEDDFKPSGSRAKGTKRKKSQKKRPCGKKAKEDIIDPSLCFFCHQHEDDVKLHEIQPEGAMEEYEALFKDEIQNGLLLDPDDEYDERLQLRATQVSFFFMFNTSKTVAKSF